MATLEMRDRITTTYQAQDGSACVTGVAKMNEVDSNGDWTVPSLAEFFMAHRCTRVLVSGKLHNLRMQVNADGSRELKLGSRV